MQNYRKILTKLRRKNLLTNSILLIDKLRLQDLINLANNRLTIRVGFPPKSIT